MRPRIDLTNTTGNRHGKAIIQIQRCRVMTVTGPFPVYRFQCSFPAPRLRYRYREGFKVMTAPNLLTPRQAAEKLGMTYPALKHWILAGR